ncbi:MAG: hypothetical protein GXN96_00705 [Aquificae bacterium]|nr:hypothetical protein [Aquificota bacterium]
MISCERPLLEREELRNWQPSFVCAECHERIYESWLTSSHALQSLSPEDRKREECRSCHAPLTVLAGKPVGRNFLPEEGVSCSSCHFDATTSSYAGPYRVFPLYHSSRESRVFSSPEFCGRCHIRTFQEWVASRENKPCQRCHMRVSDYTWIAEKPPFTFLLSRKALHDHSMSAPLLPFKVFVKENVLFVVNKEVPHPVPTSEHEEGYLVLFLKFQRGGEEEEISLRIPALEYLIPFSFPLPPYTESVQISLLKVDERKNTLKLMFREEIQLK